MTAGERDRQTASWLRKLRRRLGFTQADLAERLGATVVTVSRWERGHARPSTALWNQLRLLEAGHDVGAATPPVATLSAIRDSAAPLASSMPPSNLPLTLTSFVGRERELAELTALLSDARVRLLTLTGTAGSGKTRLALELARVLRGHYAGAIYWIELAPPADPTLIAQAVAASRGLREQPDRPLADTLISAIGTRSLLLVLDNCEHLAEGCAGLAATLLRNCPGLQILATSRAVLGVEGERIQPLPPLQLPPAEAHYGEIAAADAVRLFVDRTRQRERGFELTPENARDVAQLCRRLAGLPLALELAAARMTLRSVAQLDARLGQGLELLAAVNHTTHARHETLRAALDWSYALLGEADRRLFARLSVFTGGFTLEAAEAVGSGRPGRRDEGVVESLGKLLDHSLVERVDQAGMARFRMLELVRQYADEQLLAAGERETVRALHAAWVVALVEEAAPHLRSPEELAWVGRLNAELENIRAALNWCAQTGDAELGAAIVWALYWYWNRHGGTPEGRRWAERLLRLPEAAEPGAARAQLLWVAGALAYWQGDVAKAQRVLAECLDICRWLGEPGLLGPALLEYARAMEDVKPATARVAYEECISVFEAIANQASTAQGLNLLGRLALKQGDMDSARRLLQASIARYREAGDPAGLAMPLDNLAWLAYHLRDFDTARALSEESVALQRGLGARTASFAMSLILMAGTYRDAGDEAPAIAPLAESIALSHQLGAKVELITGLQGVAIMPSVYAEPAHSAYLFGAAEAAREAAGISARATYLHYAQQALEGLRTALGEAAHAAAWQVGRVMTLDEAAAYALHLLAEISTPETEKRTPVLGPAADHPHSLSAQIWPDERGPASPGVQGAPAGRGVEPAQPSDLSPRELEVLRLLAEGHANRVIAARLTLSEKTVHRHVANIFLKLGVASRAAAAAWAFRNGYM